MFGERALAFDERGVYTLTQISAGFGEQVEQTAGALAFAHFDGKRVEPFGWIRLVLAHQDVCIKLVRALHRSKQCSAGYRADDFSAQRFSNPQSVFDQGASLRQIAAFTVRPGEI